MSLIATVLMTAAAAAVINDPIDECRAAHGSDSAAHIACLEDALRARDAAAGPAPAAAEPAAAPAATAGQASPEPTGLGAEQTIARQTKVNTTPEQVDVRIISVRYTAAGLGVFTMSDGQVWQETERMPDSRRLRPGREYDARIRRGLISGYRLYVTEAPWMHKVKRLQ